MTDASAKVQKPRELLAGAILGPATMCAEAARCCAGVYEAAAPPGTNQAAPAPA
jgi:hypothetical protein